MKKTILIADNDQSICSIFEFILTQAGYQAIIVKNEKKISESISNSHIDLAFIDTNLTDNLNTKTIKSISDHHPLLPIILLTNHTSKNIVSPGYQAGAYGILYKPFDIEEVLNIINTITTKGEVND